MTVLLLFAFKTNENQKFGTIDMKRITIVAINNGEIDRKQIIDASLVKKSQLKQVAQNRTWYNLKLFGFDFG
ncbi:MAG: hypothetical protein ACI9Z4_000552 [Polaribacter sp.]|jgi:hypothetical protein